MTKAIRACRGHAAEEKTVDYVIVRTEQAGVFAGELASCNDTTRKVVLKNSRWLWHWAGALTVEYLALEGTTSPNSCQFPIPVPLRVLYGVKDIIHCTERGMKSIQEVPVWRG